MEQQLCESDQGLCGFCEPENFLRAEPLVMLLHSGSRPIAIVDLELADRSVTISSHKGRHYVVVRLHGIPLGVVVTGRISTNELELIANRIVAHLACDVAEKPLAAGEGRLHSLLAHEHSRHSSLLPSVSVAVCTRNRTADLEKCLRQLEKSWPAGAELLVVDNAPTTDSTERLVKSGFPWARYVCEPAVGLNRARNKAIAEATGSVVAFTDDDVRVEADWVATVQTLFGRNPEVSLMTGLVLPFEFETDAQWLFEVYGGFGRGFDRRWLRSTKLPEEGSALQHGATGTLGTGANMAIRRDVFARVGPFDPALDAGTPTQGAGDLEMFFRILKAGLTVCYEPAAVVRHCHRRTHEELGAQIESWGTGVSAYLTRCISHFPEERLPIMFLRAQRFMTWFLPRIASTLIREPQAFRLLLRELRGSFAGPSLYRLAHAEALALGDGFLKQVNAAEQARRTPLESGETMTCQIDLADTSAPLTGLNGAACVRIRVTDRGRFVCMVAAEVHDGTVGVDRMHDGIVSVSSNNLLGTDLETARRQSLALLRERLADF